MSQYIVKTVGSTISLGLLLTKDGVPLSGLTPTVEIRRVSDELYFDFFTNNWVSAGGQKELVLPEKVWAPGYYTYKFNQAMYDVGPQDYVIFYRNDLPYKLYEIEYFSFEQTAEYDISFIRKLLANKQYIEHITPDHYHHTIFDDDKVTEIYEADITMTGGVLETRDPV